RWRAEPDRSNVEHAGTTLKEVSETNPAEGSKISLPRTAVVPSEDSSAWRQEVAARLNRYQSRRKPRPPRYPSLRLRFEGEDAIRADNGISSESSTFPHVLLSNQALALEHFTTSAPLPEPSTLRGTQ